MAILSAAEKLAALNQVLSSRTFHKSDLLIKFLKYVCEKEIAGETDRLSEYWIATEALGRGKDFSPDRDSSVRSRAHALRKKLEACYRDELNSAEVKIVLPKGAYVPEFVAPEPGESKFPPEVAPSAAVRFGRSNHRLLLAFLAGVAITLAATTVIHSAGGVDAKRVALPDVLARAWGPLLDKDSEVLVVVAVAKQLWVRDIAGSSIPKNGRWYPEIRPGELLPQWFFGMSHPPDHSSLLLHPNSGSPLWGDTAGALVAVKTLTGYGIRHQVLPERVLQAYALRDRNVLLIGNPEYSPAIQALLRDAPFSVSYDPKSPWESASALVNRNPAAGEAPVFKRDRVEDCYGLITVTGSRVGGSGENRPSRQVAFSGLTSAGTQAAVEYFSSPNSLTELLKHLGGGENKALPRSYQVVVHATIEGNLPLRYTYKTHRVLAE